MMLKKLQYIGSRIYSLNTLYPKKERDRGAGWEIGRKKKQRKTEIRKHNSLKHFPVLSLALALSLSLSLFLYYSVSLSLHGFLHHLCGLVCLSISMSTDLLYSLSLLTPLSVSLPFFPALFFPFSVSLHLYSVLLSLSLSLFLSLYPSACLLYHLSFLF